ncbi:hypothetical protein OsccyDRAFT_3942 [Leptolyngbyaceae cyanobacterium JSC-12]|nr:hypothetical protein OsccyDRAFT_3942 [Leptolyngbyaceae cyanobacterium JSC-12]
MYDNKIRLSQDVLEKAEIIAQEWGLKNARAAVEAVFRRYADEYLGRRSSGELPSPAPVVPPPSGKTKAKSQSPSCDALNELDDLLGL